MNIDAGKKYRTIVADPPWSFRRKPVSVMPRYDLMDLDDIRRFPISELAASDSHLYLWVPNALVGEGLDVMRAWGFEFKTVVVWIKHQMGVGNYYRNASELVLFGVRGRLPPLIRNVRTWFLADRREHSRKPNDFYQMVERVSPGPRIDIFSREKRVEWDQFGNQCDFFNSEKGVTYERRQVIKTTGSGSVPRDCADNRIRIDQLGQDPVPQGGKASKI